MPSIREKGYYELEKKYKDKIDEFNIKIKTLIKEHKNDKNKLIERINVLENNQAKKHITKGKFIYIIKSADGKTIRMNKTEIFKMGKTKKFNARLGTINTPHKDDVYVLYKAKIDDISAVENCLKGMLSKQLYRSNREHYVITLEEAIKMIKKCIKLTKSKLIEEDKLYENHINKKYKKIIKKLSRSTTKIEDEKIDFVIDNKKRSESKSNDNKKEQIGGYILNNYDYIRKLYKYNKKIFKIIKQLAK